MTYHLVLELLPRDFMPIDINLLVNDKNNYQTIESIDNFTRNYTLLDLIKMIKNANLVPEKYLEGNLQIINENKYRYKLITKDMQFSLDTFLEKNINNKQIINKFINIYLKYSKDNIEAIKEALDNKQIDIALQNLFLLPYIHVRAIYLYLFENTN